MNPTNTPDAPGPLAKAIRAGKIDLKELQLPSKWELMTPGSPEAVALLAERRTAFYGLTATVTLDVTMRMVAMARMLSPESGLVTEQGREVRSLRNSGDPRLNVANALGVTTRFLMPLSVSYAERSAAGAVELYREYVRLYRRLELDEGGNFLDRYVSAEELLQAGYDNTTQTVAPAAEAIGMRSVGLSEDEVRERSTSSQLLHRLSTVAFDLMINTRRAVGADDTLRDFNEQWFIDPANLTEKSDRKGTRFDFDRPILGFVDPLEQTAIGALPAKYGILACPALVMFPQLGRATDMVWGLGLNALATFELLRFKDPDAVQERLDYQSRVIARRAQSIAFVEAQEQRIEAVRTARLEQRADTTRRRQALLTAAAAATAIFASGAPSQLVAEVAQAQPGVRSHPDVIPGLSRDIGLTPFSRVSEYQLAESVQESGASQYGYVSPFNVSIGSDGSAVLLKYAPISREKSHNMVKAVFDGRTWTIIADVADSSFLIGCFMGR